MENVDDVRRLMMSWPKLRALRLFPPSRNQLISLSILRKIAESCPELRHLNIQLDTSTIPPFDTASKGLRHNLEVLNVSSRVHSPLIKLERQIQVARHLDLMFPYLKTTAVHDENWSGIRDLVKFAQDVRRGWY